MPRKTKTTMNETIKRFCKNSSISSLKYVVDARRTKWERYLWLLVHIFMFATTAYIVSYAWYLFMDNPTVTTLESSAYPISEVPFPGVAICNINKISRRRAMKFAEYLSNKTGKSVGKLLNKIRLLGKLYDFEQGENEHFSKFQSILDAYDRRNGSESYNPNYRLFNLMTPCDELLERCHWQGKERNCSQLFYQRRTHEGYCCIFNYLRKPKAHVYAKVPPVLQMVYKTKYQGISGGLSVVVQNDPDDYFYPLISSIGVNIHIFNAGDYPDVSSGGLMESLVSMGTETFLKIRPTTVYAVEEVRRYPLNKRKCLFDDESTTIFGEYTFSNCFVDCKLRSMLALCQCVPFVMPIENMSTCTLADLPCLNKYNKKWMTAYPADSDNEELIADKEDSLLCTKKCYPLCSSTLYSVNTNVVPLRMTEFGNKSPHKHSYVNVYFGEYSTMVFKHDVVYYWFEILSNFGGLFGLFIGLSLISVIEFFYFIALHFIKKYCCTVSKP